MIQAVEENVMTIWTGIGEEVEKGKALKNVIIEEEEAKVMKNNLIQKTFIIHIWLEEKDQKVEVEILKVEDLEPEVEVKGPVVEVEDQIAEIEYQYSTLAAQIMFQENVKLCLKKKCYWKNTGEKILSFI